MQDLRSHAWRTMLGKNREVTDPQMIREGLSIAIGEAGALFGLIRNTAALRGCGKCIGSAVFCLARRIIRR